MATTISNSIALKDIAAEADLSIAAVSMALSDHPRISEETKGRVQTISRRLGYRKPARKTRPKRDTLRFGFVSLVQVTEEQAGYDDLLQAVAMESPKFDVRMEVTAVEVVNEQAHVLDDLKRQAAQLDGLLISGLIAPEIVAGLLKENIPTVVLGSIMLPYGQTPPTGSQIVDVNDVAIGQDATRYLIGQGHKRIAFLSEVLPRGLSADHALMGYRLAHLEANLPLDDALAHIPGRLYCGGEPFAEAFLALDDRPTAWFCPDFRLAAAFKAAMAQAGEPIDPACLVVAGPENRIDAFGLGGSPALCLNYSSLVRCAIERLKAIIANPTSSSLLCSVPHTLRTP